MIDKKIMKSLQKTQLKSYPIAHLKENIDLESYNKDLLVSVGRGRGGLYVVNPYKKKIDRRHKGIYAGIMAYKNGFMALRQPNELCLFNKKLKFKKVVTLDKDPAGGLHDLKLSNDGFIYIVSSTQNKISVLNGDTLKKEEECFLSSPEKDLHHINDLCIVNNTLLVSMFSVKGGRWKKKHPDEWDGAVVAFDRHNLVPQGILIDELIAPHSITYHNESLWYCDSLNLNTGRLDLDRQKKEVVAQFKGFTRGLFFDRNIMIVGQSKMKHLQRLRGKFDDISFDGGLHFYDCEKRTGKFMKLPVGNPYAIIAIK